MPPKAKLPAPIDRPLSRAYLREFTGLSTAFPPGLSDPTSLRSMDNMLVNRDGSCRIRPGLRYMSYASGGVPLARRPLGTHEAFYLNDGAKAYLFAVKETDGTVGFRALRFDGETTTVFTLPEVGFTEQAGLRFSSNTTYVKYLQIDNKIFALSDAGEPMRIFYVGNTKLAKPIGSIDRPAWGIADKLAAVEPDAVWINSGTLTNVRYNMVMNPDFVGGTWGWNMFGGTTYLMSSFTGTPIGNKSGLTLIPMPTRTNLIGYPLGNIPAYGTAGWSNGSLGFLSVSAGTTLQLTVNTGPAGRRAYANGPSFAAVEGEEYRCSLLADSYVSGISATGVMFRFYGSGGAQVGSDMVRPLPFGSGSRVVTGNVTAPSGAVSGAIFVYLDAATTGLTAWRWSKVMVTQALESTSYFDGDSGTNFFWTGVANASASVFQPPQVVGFQSALQPTHGWASACASIYAAANTTARNVQVALYWYDGSGNPVGSPIGGTAVSDSGWVRPFVGGSVPAGATQFSMAVSIANVPRGEFHYITGAMYELGTTSLGVWFNHDSADTSTVINDHYGTWWAQQQIYGVGVAVPAAETPTANTLVSSDGSKNIWNFAFFYCFNNELGESAHSQMTMLRTQRSWSAWRWETANVSGEPSGTATDDPAMCADQIVCSVPSDAWMNALYQGATSWTLYMLTWNDQEPIPVSAVKVGTKDMNGSTPYGSSAWMRVTPVVSDTGNDYSVLPNLANRYNYSNPSRGSQGLVAADRMVIVNDRTAGAVVRWTSNHQGEYSNFSASKGGGYKTLTSGNLMIPATVKLWQNPQSADTITILCMGTDGHSTGYYMAPAQVAQQSEATNIMGFEETTATPGTTSPYGCEVFNNALYHPLDDQLMKSTATNYNINHKSQTDNIRDIWERLERKQWIISSQFDGRIYYIVNNPDGAALEAGCNGNEIWVMDAGGTDATWSRWTIQAHSLRKIEFGGRIYMSVIRPDGIYYLDPEYDRDDFVSGSTLANRCIPWSMETNTQGANRAHDAWAHLQQASIMVGNFWGEMEYGIRGYDVNGKAVDIKKRLVYRESPTLETSDFEDFLQIRKDMKEWRFYANSVFADGDEVAPSFGQINLVQYRYAPVSVNVGYEYGSIETFEYGRASLGLSSEITTNGIPVPMIETRRP